MLKVHTLTLGLYQTNCYIIHEETSKTCCVIDPGYSPAAIAQRVNQLGLRIEAILLTHCHFDHVGAVEALVKATGCALWMHQGDYSQTPGPMTDTLYPLHDKDFTLISFCEEGEVIHAAGLDITVLATPGHSWGSVCYQCEDVLFSGDTLFAGSCGRTDLPGGDWDTILESLHRLSQLEGDFTVCPGHGESTTLAQEKLYNPYLK